MENKSCADWQCHLLGTTLVLIATDAFDSYQKATGGVLDKATGLLSITSTQYYKLKSFFIHVNGVCVLSWAYHWQSGVISLPFSPGCTRINS